MTDEEQTPSTPAPSPRLFARPGQASDSSPVVPTDGLSVAGTGTAPSHAADGTDAALVDARFPATGDARVDQVIAQLPDPQVHRRGVDEVPDGTSPGQLAPDQPIGGALPDPALLDEHITDVTSVHRQLQQRLSDLSG